MITAVDKNKLMSTKKRIGKYIMHLNDELGKGAFSIVYGGVVEETGESVAIKMVSKNIVEQDEYNKNAFISEIKIMKRLNSRNIIHLIDVHETKNNFYIILERAQSTLRRELRECGPLDEAAAMSCLIQILNGFGELVMNGVIHRDLKPDNILLCGGILKIGDFGFAKNLNSTSSMLKTLVGTPAYMAPQILKEERYTYKCDIWSLGVIVYEMVVGKIPWQFTQNNLQCFRKEILTRQVTIPETVAISANMRNFIHGCICLDEQKRLDWGQIFSHPLFGRDLGAGYFKKEGSTKINFIMSNFRMNIHSKNLSLNKILASTPSTLSKNHFKQFVLMVQPYSTEQDISVFFKYIEKDGAVTVQALKSFLVKHDCSLTGMQLGGMKAEETNSDSPQNRNLAIIQCLKNAIEKGNLAIWPIFSAIKDKDVNFEVFKQIVWRVDASMSENDCEFFFKAFDVRGSKVADVASLYRFLCKIAQEVPRNE